MHPETQRGLSIKTPANAYMHKGSSLPVSTTEVKLDLFLRDAGVGRADNYNES